MKPTPSTRIAAAQTVSTAGDVAANVRMHTKFITTAHQAQVDLLVFPELSLSGYELPLLRDCRLQPDDYRLAPIRDLAQKTRMTVVVGAPLDRGEGVAPFIAAITFLPDGSTSVYCKQYLHPGEEKYVGEGPAGNHSHAFFDKSFALAICADTLHEQHAVSAAATGASLYLASVLVSEAGYAADSAKLHRYATELNVGVLMSNHGGPSGGYVSAGRSSFWAPGGKLVAAASGAGDFLVIASHRAGEWSGELLAA